MPRIAQHVRRRIETVAYNRAADLAKSYAEHWEYVAAKKLPPQTGDDRWDAKTKAGHWRIIEKEIRAVTHLDNEVTKPKQ
jgi:hypothetical protein